jgi:CRISPR-associated protein Csd1
MSWIERLHKTYENNVAHIGDRNDVIPLLPICHTTQNAQVTVVIDASGNFLRASVVPKNEARTIIPATEESAGRTSGYVPHPLFDKLQYVAGDYSKYGGGKPSEFEKYRENLEAWCSSQYMNPKVRSVLDYIQKGRLIQDLVSAKVFHLDDKGALLEKWTEKSVETPEIFKVIQGEGGQAGSFIRFSVEISGDPKAALWNDSTVWECWKSYYANMKSGNGLCYVTGEQMTLADQHPAKIRNSGDKAKLISSNDTSGYTFRGRFTTADEACGIGFEVTQKAHSALRWLIPRQGWRDGEQAIVAWAVSGAKIPDPFADTLSLLSGAGDNSTEIQVGYTAQEIGTQLTKRIAGYSVKLGITDDVVVMGLDSATPGRMAVTFYRELTGSEFLERIRSWHDVDNGCTWRQRLGKDRVFTGAPTPRDIAEAAYGKRLDDKLRKATIERLLPCIIDGAPIPRDLVESCVRRANNKNSLEAWEWEKTLGIACALYRHQHSERRYTMALERDRKTRDYLYGRLLALAEHLEGRALYVAGEKRETNAGKLMQRFAERPYSTWLNIETSLTPYKVRLRAKRPGFLHNVEKEIDEVACSFSTEDFLSDRRLTGEFLLGYHCQRAALRPEAEQDTTDTVDVED